MGDTSEERTQINTVHRGGGVPIQYPMLNDTNYGVWAVKMKFILKALGVWDEVESKEVKDKEKNHGALAAIIQSIPDSFVMDIAEKESANEAWNRIREIVVDEDRVRRAKALILKRQLDRMIMAETESIVEFSQKMMSKVGEIRSLGIDLKENIVVEKLFSAVPDNFLSVVGIIELWEDTSKMTVAEAVRRLRMFEEGSKGRQQQKEGMRKKS